MTRSSLISDRVVSKPYSNSVELIRVPSSKGNLIFGCFGVIRRCAFIFDRQIRTVKEQIQKNLVLRGLPNEKWFQVIDHVVKMKNSRYVEQLGTSPDRVTEGLDVEIRNRMQKNPKYRQSTYLDDDFVKEYPKIKRILKRFRTPRSPNERVNSSTTDFRYFDLVYIRTTLAMSTNINFHCIFARSSCFKLQKKVKQGCEKATKANLENI